MSKKPDKEVLKKYIEKGMTMREMANNENVSHQAVSAWLKDYNLKTKYTAEDGGYARNLVGDKYGKLKVISYEKTGDHGKEYLCKCECGNEKVYRGNVLTGGHVEGCGCQIGKKNKGNTYPEQAKSKIGKKFGKLEVTDVKPPRNSSGYRLICSCECGEITTANHRDLNQEKVKSCGCLQKKNGSKIGMEYGKNNYKSKYQWYFQKEGKKISCRSGFEVIYANWLMEDCIDFEYEPRSLKVDNQRYLPDFYIVDENKYIEIKGYFKDNQKGKIQKIEEELSVTVDIKFWEDIVSDCGLQYNSYNHYMKLAKQSEFSVEKYFAESVFLS